MKYSKRKEANIRRLKNPNKGQIAFLKKAVDFRIKQKFIKIAILKSALSVAMGAVQAMIIQATPGATKQQKAIAIMNAAIITAEQACLHFNGESNNLAA